MKFRQIDKRLSKLERVSRPETPQANFIVQYEYPATATGEEKEAAKAAAMDRFLKEHPEFEGRRFPLITLGVAHGDIALPGEEEP